MLDSTVQRKGTIYFITFLIKASRADEWEMCARWKCTVNVYCYCKTSVVQRAASSRDDVNSHQRELGIIHTPYFWLMVAYGRITSVNVSIGFLIMFTHTGSKRTLRFELYEILKNLKFFICSPSITLYNAVPLQTKFIEL